MTLAQRATSKVSRADAFLALRLPPPTIALFFHQVISSPLVSALTVGFFVSLCFLPRVSLTHSPFSALDLVLTTFTPKPSQTPLSS